MRDSEGPPADVLLDGHVPLDQQQALVDALAALGVRADAKVLPARRGLGELPWLVLVSLPLQAFLSSVGSKLAEDAYQGFKRAIDRLASHGQEQRCLPAAGRIGPIAISARPAAL